jgi:tetratricopeptide (TPR) repeat protein
MAHDVFISYSAKDKTTADAICASLEANGIRAWIAPRDVMPGSEWGEAIIEAIEQTQIMVLVFSASSNTSPQIKREIERAVNKGVPVVPFRIDEVMPSKTLEYFISTQHWLDAFTPPLERHLQSLVTILQAMLRKTGGVVTEPRLKPDLPEERAALGLEPQVARGREPATITLKLPAWKILIVVLAFVAGALVAGGVVWWAVYRQPPTPSGEKGLTASDYFEQGKQARDADEKIALFTKAIELNPKAAYFHIFRGQAYLSKNEYHKALSDLDKAIAAIPNSYVSYNYRGLVYDALGKHDQAIIEFNKAISLSPTFAEAFNNRGKVYFQMKEYDKALHDYNQAISLDAQFAQAYNNRGVLYIAQKKQSEALHDYNKAISIDPKLLDAYINRGIYYFHQKAYDQALNNFNKALPLNWRHAVTFNARGEVYAARGDFEWALNDFNRAISLNPKFGKAYKNRGMVYMEIGNYKKSLHDLNQAISLNVDLPESYELRGKLYEKRGDEVRARYDFDKARSLK